MSLNLIISHNHYDDAGYYKRWYLSSAPHPKSKGSRISQQDVYVNLQTSGTKGGSTEPNFVWEIIKQNHKGSRMCNCRHKYEASATTRETISLFDVSSVQRAMDSVNIDINAYPHAKPKNSILITLNNGNVQLFEARSE